MKFGVCAILKNEDLYLREWVEHYIKLGFDKIILYIDEDSSNIYPKIILQEFIDANIVDIYYTVDMLDKKLFDMHFFERQVASYENCLNQYKNQLDWILYVDLDEFLTINDDSLLNLFKKNNFDTLSCIIINWKCIGNNNDLYYENKNVTERFTKEGEFMILDEINSNLIVKSFVNTKLCNHIYGIHIANLDEFYDTDKIKYYSDEDYKNIEILYRPIHTFKKLYDKMYIKHYYTKSLTEYLYKLFNGWTKKNKNDIAEKIKFYKQMNGWSNDCEKVYQNFLKQNNITL